MPDIVLNRWRMQDDQTSVPKASTSLNALTNASNATSSGGENIQDASFIRLKNVSVSYSFPKQWINHLKLSNVELSLQGQNLYTWSNFIGLDPETQNLAALPPLRTFVLALNVNF